MTVSEQMRPFAESELSRRSSSIIVIDFSSSRSHLNRPARRLYAVSAQARNISRANSLSSADTCLPTSCFLSPFGAADADAPDAKFVGP